MQEPSSVPTFGSLKKLQVWDITMLTITITRHCQRALMAADEGDGSSLVPDGLMSPGYSNAACGVAIRMRRVPLTAWRYP